MYRKVEMGICWSEPPVQPVRTMYIEKPSAPPVYIPPPNYNPNYTYAVKQEQPVYTPYQQPYPQQYPVQYAYAYPQQVPQRQTSPATAFVGGLVLGAIAEDILDPCD